MNWPPLGQLYLAALSVRSRSMVGRLQLQIGQVAGGAFFLGDAHIVVF